MILFKTLRWKNFLSTGNNWSELDFGKEKTTLVVGQNGAGKSTMLDALAYALFGKAHRNIKNAQLVNSINKKGTIVEVTFNVAGSDFKIIRGQKPTIFEIWKGDVMLNQDSHAKEYQKILEQNILKLNHKSFHQIVVLGSSSFIPFMQLSANYRKDVIEDLLDIGVFSKMNSLLKEKTSSLRENIKDVTHKIELQGTKIDSQKKYIRDIENLNNQQKKEKKNLIEEYRTEIKTLQSTNKELSDKINDRADDVNKEKQQIESAISQLNTYKTKFSTQVNKIVKEVRFFEENDICPTCDQSITLDVKNDRIATGKNKAKELQEAMERADSNLSNKQSALSTVEDEISTIREYQSNVYANNQSIDNFQKAIDRILVEIEDTKGDVEQEKKSLSSMQKCHSDNIENKLKLNEQFQYNQVIATMLKDTGIKTKIIKQYLPVINKLCNQFLQILDFYVHFELDEAFVETIRSRHRDQFTYDSFSEGEKQRIDLALLFTWRQVAKMKNSVATNLLILDETFDSSLDHEGVDNLMKIIYALGDDTNVFVISHKGDVLEGRFANRIEFVKDKNFSRMQYGTK
jgi:DNA repair exonuclease SbcCD ATPase subunit